MFFVDDDERVDRIREMKRGKRLKRRDDGQPCDKQVSCREGKAVSMRFGRVAVVAGAGPDRREFLRGNRRFQYRPLLLRRFFLMA